MQMMKQLAEAVTPCTWFTACLRGNCRPMLEHDRLANLNDILDSFEQLTDIRDMISEGYRRLDSTAKRVIEALSVFRRPIDARAVEFLLESVATSNEIQNSIQHLIRARMIEANRTTGQINLTPN